MAKYIKRGVKRKHDIIQDILPLLEHIAQIDGIKKVVPANISYSPTRGIEKPIIRFQRDTISGFKAPFRKYSLLLMDQKRMISDIN